MPIRLLHFSDAHIGIENYGRIDPKTGLNSRLADFTAVLDETVERALQGDVDLVVFTGDAYRSRDPSPTHQREFARRIHRLSRAGIPVFLLVGNHDLPAAAGRANSVDIFETLEVPNVYVGRKPETLKVPTRRGPVQVVALPWIAQSLLFAKEELRAITADQARQKLAEFTASFLDGAVASLDPSLPAVLAAHLVVMGATYSSEQSAMLGQELVLPRSVVANPAFDYVALGHVHRHQLIAYLPLTLYAGSLERVDFGEESEDKGFVLVDVEKGRAEHQFVKVAARRFLTVRADALEGDPTEATLAALARHEVAEAVVRVEITTTPEQEAIIDYGAIRRALRDAYHVAGIVKRVEDRDRVRVPGLGALTPLEALRAYLRSKSTPAERLEALAERGARLVAESDGDGRRGGAG